MPKETSLKLRASLSGSKPKGFRWMAFGAAKPPKARSGQSRRLAEAIARDYATVEEPKYMGYPKP